MTALLFLEGRLIKWIKLQSELVTPGRLYIFFVMFKAVCVCACACEHVCSLLLLEGYFSAFYIDLNILAPCACVCSVTSDSLQPPGLIARQVPLSMGFSRLEYWSGLPFPLPGDLLIPWDWYPGYPIPDIQGLNPCLLRLLHWQVDSLPLSHLGNPSSALDMPD